MAVFEFPVGGGSRRSRLAGPPRRPRSGIVAVATMSDGALYAAAAEVIVTIAGCMDGT